MAGTSKRRREAGQVAWYRGERLGCRELGRLQRIAGRCAGQTRAQMAEQVCRRFQWRRPGGEWSVVSCRALLLRLERRGLIQLPPPLGPRSAQRQRRQSPVPVRPKAEPAATVGHQQPTGPLQVRPIRAEEQAAWRQCMERHHYLGCGRLVGESLRYAAFVGSEQVALLGWAAAALRNGPRDRYLGWDAATRARNLPLVVNNVRFLMLPSGGGVPNLASRVLAANLRRLRRDWEAAYGHPVLLAETFVDLSRFRGTCYRASNWQALGQTRGFSRVGASYERNGAAKAVFVYPLDRRARERLKAKPAERKASTTEVTKMAREKLQLDWKRLPLEGRGGLIDMLRQLDDPRKPRGVRHPMVAVMAIAVCATVSGAQHIAAIAQWAQEQSTRTLQRFWCRKGKPPSESCIRRVLGAIDTERLDQRVGEWLLQHSCCSGEGLALDGKTLRGSREGDAKAFHLVSAVLHREGLVLAQHRVPDKTNEIKSVQPLLDRCNVEGAVVTGDAMFTQKDIARHLVQDKHADYLLFVKGNQPTLLEDIEQLHLETFPPSAHHPG